MARDVPIPPPQAAPSSTAGTPRTTTWGTEHFERAPKDDELRKVPGNGQIPNFQPGQQPKDAVSSQQAVSVGEAIKTIKAKDFLSVYQYPCSRQGLLTGIGGGAAVGMLRYILGANIPKATNWAVGAFALGGIVSFEVCQAARRAERNKMKRVVEVFDHKQTELRQREAEKARQQREQKEKEEQEAAAARARRKWYRVW